MPRQVGTRVVVILLALVSACAVGEVVQPGDTGADADMGADGDADSDTDADGEAGPDVEAGDADDDGEPCEDECGEDETRCALAGPAGVQICGQVDEDECLDWAAVTRCGEGEACDQGECFTPCEDECGEDDTRCALAGPAGVQICGQVDEDECLEWAAVVRCDAGDECAEGECFTPCEDECARLGLSTCTPTGLGFRLCGESDDDDCLDLGDVVPCGEGETCSDGDCICGCDFFAEVCEPDAPGSTDPCACDPDCDSSLPCSADGHCDSWCPAGADPDCICGCDFFAEVCEPDAPGSTDPCACDPDCDSSLPCSADGHCDSWCPAGTDPDCVCDCDWNASCEAAELDSTLTCGCDPHCEPHEAACSDDTHCDSWCPAGVDPDCGVDACRPRLVSMGWLFADEALADGSFESPDSDLGAPWVLVGGGGAGWLEAGFGLTAEHADCFEGLVLEVHGLDDSLAGDGADLALFNWSTWQFDLLGATIGPVEDDFSAAPADPLPYLLCGAESCFVDALVWADEADRTHVETVAVWVELGPA